MTYDNEISLPVLQSANCGVSSGWNRNPSRKVLFFENFITLKVSVKISSFYYANRNYYLTPFFLKGRDSYGVECSFLLFTFDPDLEYALRSKLGEWSPALRQYKLYHLLKRKGNCVWNYWVWILTLIYYSLPGSPPKVESTRKRELTVTSYFWA